MCVTTLPVTGLNLEAGATDKLTSSVIQLQLGGGEGGLRLRVDVGNLVIPVASGSQAKREDFNWT